MALRLDYLANKKLTVGGTIVRLGERPFFTKQGYGDDPIRNTMYGVDFDYRMIYHDYQDGWISYLFIPRKLCQASPPMVKRGISSRSCAANR